VDNENILVILKNYVAQKMVFLTKTKWPYDIDEKSFIRIIDIANGDLLDISSDDLEFKTNSYGDGDCISYIEQQICEKSVICVGYYGMGKSTISKMLFKKSSTRKNTYPILLNLTHVNLENYCSGGLEKQVAAEIERTLLPRNQNPSMPRSLIQDWEKLQNEINKLINSQKLLLILDGIDESICDKPTIFNFIKDLSYRNCLVFLTCRLEFSPFFDAIDTLRNSDEEIYEKLNGIRLLNWQKPQWEEYAKGLLDKYPEKEESIKDFIRNVIDEKYSNLPARPLFFKMLSDLIINNQTNYQISLKLQSNLSEIYYKFICWKIYDDLIRKGSSIKKCDVKRFEKEGFELLKYLSLYQYKKNLENDVKGVNLETIKKICRDRKFNVIFESQIAEILLYSSLFSIIRRHDEDEFMFSHKSFMEYLVAYNIADGLLTRRGTNLKPECNKNWDLFQTHEVSNHLMDEIERIRITYGLTEEERNKMLLQAFQSALEEVKDPYHYDARIEEILYYIGKFRIKSPQIIDYLKKLIENKEYCPEDYYRTASISLSRVVDRSYCENYVLGLLDDLKGEGKRFKLNKKIQLQYYGEANIRRTLKRELDKYIAKDSQSCIVSLRILTYFTSIPQMGSEKILEHDYLQKIYAAAKVVGDIKIQEICNIIENIL